MKPTIPLHDARFVYVNSAHTDIRKRFERVRKEMAAAAKASDDNVKPITTQKRKATA